MDNKNIVINNPAFNYTKRNLLLISLAIVIFAMSFFSIVTLVAYRLIVYSDIDNAIDIQYSMLYEDIDKIQKKGFDINPPKDDFHNPPEIPIYHFSLMKNAKMIVFIYQNNKLIYSTNNPYFTDFRDTSKELSNKTTTFKFDSHNFRGCTFKQGVYSYTLCYNVDSEIQSMIKLATVMGVCLVVFMFIVRKLATYLSNKAMVPVENSYIKQVEFIQDASHEMRTPLAVIKGKLELLVVNPTQTIEDRYEDISEIMSEVVNMEKMNKNLLVLSKEDVGNTIKIEEFTLNKLINQIKDFFTDLAEAKDIDFEIKTDNEDAIVNWDYEKMKQALTILLDNAFKYSNEDDSITLLFEEKGKNIILSVSDTGCGIDKKSLSRIYDRFYRTESARASEIDGSGIGLCILKSLSRILNFKIDVQSEVDVGTTFILTIPKNMK